MIRVEQLTFSYLEKPVLREVSFEIDKGETVVLLGPNGAGKSTLLLLLAGVLQGEGTIESQDPVGLVFQNPDDQLFCPTVAEDVGYGPRYQGLGEAEVSNQVRSALAQVGLAGLEDRFPLALSGGEKKRVALATVLSMEPTFLALDEPTAGLDARARRAVIEALQRLEQSLLVATHDLELAQELSHRALVLDQGSVVYDGPLQPLLENEQKLILYGLKA